MRVISWNVNGIRSAEKKGFTEWLVKESPDILCLNETKAQPSQLSQALLSPPVEGAPYHVFWACAKKKGYSGVAIYTKEKPLEARFFGIGEFDDEGRVLIAEYGGFTLIAAYFPNSGDEGKRLGYKLGFCEAMLSLCNDLSARGRHFLLCGDYNIAHKEIDLARPKQNQNNAGFLPQEREWMDRFTAAGHVDTFRRLHEGEGGHYTWWSYMGAARAKNVGWRIDYHCVDSGFVSKVKSSVIRPDVTGSDHCPVEVELDI